VAKIDVIEVGEIHQYLDFINVMTYDFAGSWSAATNFNAPLHRTTDPRQPQDDLTQHANAHAAMAKFLDGGTPPDKLVLGVPFYGRGWREVPDVNNGLYQPHGGETRLRASWRELKANDLYGMERFWHEEAGVPWLFDADKGIMVSYDDPESLRLKAEYVRERELGGVMFWQITGDDEDDGLVRALLTGLSGETR